MTEFRKGDRVSILATVVDTDEGWPAIVVDHQAGGSRAICEPSRLTLVERPVKKVTVTLTEEQLRAATKVLGARRITSQDDEFQAYRVLARAVDSLD